jgi:S1-C subfamily serine protease
MVLNRTTTRAGASVKRCDGAAAQQHNGTRAADAPLRVVGQIGKPIQEKKMIQVLICALVFFASGMVATSAAAQEPVRGARVMQVPGWLGLTFNYERAGTGARAEELAVVTAVHPTSPAARAGLQTGDAIVRVNGRTDIEAQIRALRLQPGDTVRVRVRREGQRDRDVAIVAERRPAPVALGRPLREGQRYEFRRVPGDGGVIILNGDTIRVPVDSLIMHADSLQRRIRVLITDSLGPRLRELEAVRMPEIRERFRMLDTAFVRAFPEGFVFEVGRRAVAGAEFSELNPELADYFQGVREGLLVLRVAPESPASRAGLQAGDVVVRVNGEAVRNTTDLRRHVARAGREEVRLGVVRRGRQVELRMR